MAISYSMVEDGSYTQYGRDVTFVMYGGYAEVEGPEVTLEQNYSESHVWQGYDYDGTVTFASPDNVFGSSAPEAIDVARIYTAPDGSTTAYDRSGYVVPLGDPEVDQMGASPEASSAPSYSRAPAAESQALSQQARAPRDKREPVDRVFVTPGASQRALARLRAVSVERAGPGGTVVLTRRDAEGEVEETWDPGVGAVTRVRARDGRGNVSQTENRYTRDGQVLVLTEERTTLHDPHGKLLGKFDFRYRNHRLN
jgi:hypothetical protein